MRAERRGTLCESASDSASNMEIRVSSLLIYPVKSCRAIALEESALETRGLRHDRRWMIVDEVGKFMTQREEPRLALIDVALADHSLVLSTPTMGPLSVAPAPANGEPRRRVRVWRDEVDAIDCGGDAGRWLSEWLGRAASLVFMPDNVTRPVNPNYARAGDITSFADGYPLLLASESSLEDLNRRLEKPVPMNRFRPNIVVRGSPSWAEDGWKQIRVADVPIRVVKPCSRCVITTTDQETGARGIEPLRALATFRAHDNEVWFAQNCIPDDKGTLAVGDPVRVLSP
jgi:uncharacterized protein YcbX